MCSTSPERLSRKDPRFGANSYARSPFHRCRCPFGTTPRTRSTTAPTLPGSPDVWSQGDFASWTEHGGLVIHGRSDATLNAGGVRIGTAEIYRQVENLPQVVEALAIGQQWDDDTRIVLFVRLAPGVLLDEELVGTIRRVLRENCSPRHVPAKVIAVDDLPRTRSNKLAELAVADVVHGREVRNVEALANPESLELFREIPELAN